MRLTDTFTHSACSGAFLALTLDRGLAHERHREWSTAARAIPRLGELVASSASGAGAGTRVFARDDGAIRVSLDGGWVECAVAAAGSDDAEALLAAVAHELPELPEPEETPRVDVSFWAMGSVQPGRRSRRLEVFGWDAVAANYPAATRGAMEALIGASVPLPGGRLLLWHGPPGTGKTNALRALAWEWREQAHVHYVTDPDLLLTAPGYLQAVLLGAPGDPRFRLIVLEDAAELLSRDTQALGRLLNLTDGFVGQGVDVLVLVTGNEPLNRLHPALSRPGRCAAPVAFECFDAGEAAAWLGVERAAGGSLAELWAVREGRAPLRPERRLGFVA